MKKWLIVQCAFVVVTILSLTGCPNPADSSPKPTASSKFTTVNKAAIQGVTAPVTGGTPVKTITETAQYTGTVTWSPAHSTFVADTQYTAAITLKAKEDYTLQGVAANFFTVAGALLTSNNAESGVITAVFPKTSGTTETPTVINIISAIQGIAIPAKGETPVTSITENEQYTGTVTWSPNHSVFAASTVYTATITLTLKTGYTWQGVTSHYFTVDGAASVSNAANSGVITAVFPSTDATAITIAAIPGVTVPVNGAIPVTKITKNEQYSGTVTWNGNPVTFVAETQYTATIMLTPKAGYTLHGVAADFFTVEGAISVTNNAHSGDITAVFPATASTSIPSVSIIITAPVKGATPDTTADSEGHFTTGTVSWLPPGTSTFLGGAVYTAVVTLTANSGYSFTGLNSATINGQSAAVTNNTGAAVTLSYTFPATNTKTVTDIAIKTQPSKLTYTHGDTLDLDGLVVTLTHDDGTTEDVAAADFADKNVTSDPWQGDTLVHSTHNGHSVEITYGSLTCNTNNLTVNRATPTDADFTIGGTGTFTYDGNPKTVTVTPKEDKSNGTITVKYNGSTTAPSAAGEYTVTFDVAEGTNYNAANGFPAGTLTITIANFTIAPTLTLTADNTKLTYTWTASNPVADSYDIYWKAGNNLSAADVKTGTKITGARSGGSISGLTNGTTYSVLVTANKTGYNAIDSTVGTVTPIQANAAKPVISAQPQGGIFFKTGTLSVTASVTDGGTLTYQWYRNTSNSTYGGTAIAGATGSSYTLSDMGTYYYYVVITNTITNNGYGESKTAYITSDVAAVTVEQVLLAQWARTGNFGSQFFATAVDSSGNVYAAGEGILVKYDSSGTAQWTQKVTGKRSWFNAVAVDSSGNVYAAGCQDESGTYTYGPGVSAQGNGYNKNVVLVKYKSDGTALWATSVSAVGSTGATPYGNSQFNAVAVDSYGNVYAAGCQRESYTYTYGPGVSAQAQGNSLVDNVVLVKYKPDGTALWATSVSVVRNTEGTDPGFSEFNAVAVDSFGNVYAAGSQQGNSINGIIYTYSPGISAQGAYKYKNVVLVKYNSSGTAQWARTVSTGNDVSEFYAVAVDSSDNVYAAGYQKGKSTYTYSPGVSAQGTCNSTSTDYAGNVILVKYNSSGTAQWAQTVIAGDETSVFNAVAVDSSGNIYAAGKQGAFTDISYGMGVSAQGSGNMFFNVVLVKYNSSGTAQWARASISDGNSFRGSVFNTVVVDSSGNVYAAGSQDRTGTYTYGTGVSAQGTSTTSNPVLVKYRE